MFVQAAYDSGWVLDDFDWMSWEAGRRFGNDPMAIANATIEDIERLLTAYIRADRFCEGYLASVYESGHLIAVVRRLEVLREDNGMTGYLALCERLWNDWMHGRVQLERDLQDLFDLEHAPEPYIVFGEGSDPLYALLTNPGQPMPHQHRSELSDKPRYGVISRGG